MWRGARLECAVASTVVLLVLASLVLDLCGVEGPWVCMQEWWQCGMSREGDGGQSRDLTVVLADCADFSASRCLQAWCERERVLDLVDGPKQMRSEMNRPGSE